jgi:hypothetical protein
VNFYLFNTNPEIIPMAEERRGGLFLQERRTKFMKKIIALFCAVLMLALTACKEAPTPEVTTLPETISQVETTPSTDAEEGMPEIKEPIDTMEKLTRVDGVL